MKRKEYYYFYRNITKVEYRNFLENFDNNISKYKEKCAKWKPLMLEISSLRNSGIFGTLQGADYDEYMKVMRHNILTMAHYAFPNVVFDLKLEDSFLCSWTLSYKNGPTEEELRAATNFELFTVYDFVSDNVNFGKIIERSSNFCSFAREFLGEKYGVCVVREIAL